MGRLRRWRGRSVERVATLDVARSGMGHFNGTPGRQVTITPPVRPHSMQALVWLLRLFIVAILIWFALKNSQLVDVNGLPGQVWQAPLVFVLLVAFVAGVVIGLLGWVPT